MDNPFTNDLRRKLDEVYAGACDQLERIDELPSSVNRVIVGILLEEACRSQHIGKIISARRAIQLLPSRWLPSILGTAIGEVIDMDDEWEYRRLIELLKELKSSLLTQYLEYGLASNINAIHEAAVDMLNV